MNEQQMNPIRSVQARLVRSLRRGLPAVAACACFSMALTPAQAQYQRTDLVANQPGAAPLQDPNLINGWGLVSLPGSPYWVSDNGTGLSTLYTAAGARIPLVVAVPPPPASLPGTLGTPTGIVGNISPNASDFTVKGNGTSARALFIFASLDGSLSGWNPAVAVVSGGISHAVIAADRSGAGAIYTGLAIAVNASKEAFLYAADDGPNSRVDMFDSSFSYVGSFTDPNIPKTFAPYGIQTINGQIWVTYTALNKAQGGFVDVFNTEGVLLKHFAVQGPLHSPWGVALAPANFGPMSNAILISNNTSRGRINAFNPESGEFMGPLRDASGKAIEIDGIWAIQFGQGAANNGPTNQLFFTAGQTDYADGLFGTIKFVP